MAASASSDLTILKDKCAHFAEQHLAHRIELSSIEAFPMDLWKIMGREKILGFAADEAYGGGGCDYPALSIAGAELVKEGYNLGMVLSWMMHQLVTRFFIMGFGSKRQRAEYLPGLAAGTVTASVAISEPGRGNHPKHLEARARAEDGEYIITGEKTYLTNGPIADMYIVFAITAVEDDRKRYTAFLVPRATPGLHVKQPMKLPFLRPATHGGIEMRGCRVGPEAILGTVGTAYEDMAIPFRHLEDSLMMGPLSGGMEALLNLLISKETQKDGAPSDGATKLIGHLGYLVRTLRIIAYEAAGLAQNRVSEIDRMALGLSFQRCAEEGLTALRSHARSLADTVEDQRYAPLHDDMERIISFSAKHSDVRQAKLGILLYQDSTSRG